MKSNKLYLITGRGISCKSGLNNHTHNDVLSFEISSFDNNFIVDPGTYTYTPSLKERNDYRSTKMHNTVMIDNVEQNDFISYFKMTNYANLKINEWISSDDFDFLDFEHYGYLRLENPVIHKRRIIFNKNKDFFWIADEFSGLGKHKFEWNFHFTANAKVQLAKNYCSIIVKNEALKINFPSSCSTMILQGCVFASYGQFLRSSILRLWNYSELVESNNYKLKFNFKIAYKFRLNH